MREDNVIILVLLYINEIYKGVCVIEYNFAVCYKHMNSYKVKASDGL